MRRIALLVLPLTFAFAGCRSDNGATTPINYQDLSASTPSDGGAGGDMTVPVGTMTTIAAARSGMVRTTITVTAIVTAVHGTGEWYVQDVAGGMWSGIDVYCNPKATKNPCPASVKMPNQGDIVQITGVIAPYKNKDELAPAAQTTMSTMNKLPAAMTVATTDAGELSGNAALRGMLVNVTPPATAWTVDDVMPAALINTTACPTSTDADGGCIMCAPPQYSGFEVTDGTTKIYVYNYFFGTSHLTSSPECVPSAPTTADNVVVTTASTFTALGGILDIDPYAPTAGTVVLAPASDAEYAIH
jgi:hypothetical protein